MSFNQKKYKSWYMNHGSDSNAYDSPYVKTPKTATNAGSGYGGSTRDATLRKQGQRQALKREQGQWAEWQQDLETFLALQRDTKAIKLIVTEKHPVLDTLKKVLRCQAPNWWWKQPQRRTYVLALQVAVCLTQRHPQAWGDADDTESAIASLEELARTCKLLLAKSQPQPVSIESLAAQLEKASTRRTSTNEKDLLLPNFVLSIQQATLKAIATGDCFLTMGKEEYYRQKLRPLAFDLVSPPFDSPKHHYAPGGGFNKSAHYKHHKKNTKANSGNSNRATTVLWKELSTYPTALPIEYGSSIFVRAHEADMDKIRVLIIGPEDTPYANGCFMFDVWVGNDYPNQPPKVQFLTTNMFLQGRKKYNNATVRFNPNLYNCGKVCLSLLGTWSGPGWSPKESTLLQVLVSLQSLVLGNPTPYFNEPGYQSSEGTKYGELQSKKYNTDIRKKTLRVAMLPFLLNQLQPRADDKKGSKKRTISNISGGNNNHHEWYPEFREVLEQHFRLKKQSIRNHLRLWLKEDPTLQDLVRDFWEVFEQVEKSEKERNHKCRKKAAPPASNAKDEVILLDDDDDVAVNSRPKDRDTNDNGVIELLDNDDDYEDRKPAAKIKKTRCDDVVDLT